MPTRLAQYLVAKGTLTSQAMGDAVRTHAAKGGSLDTVFLELGQISETQLLEALGDLSGFRTINLTEFEPNHAVSSLIPPKIAERLGLVPLSLEQETLHVACTYPVPEKELKEIGFLLGKELELWIALEVRVREWLAELYGFPLTSRHESLLASLQTTRSASSPPVGGPQAMVESTLEEELAREMKLPVGDPTSAAPIPLRVRKSDLPFPWLEGDPSPTPEAVLPEAVSSPSPTGEEPSRLTLQQARFALHEASGNADRILGVAMRFAQSAFEFVAAFIVQQGYAVGWDVRGQDWDTQRIARICVPLDVFSVFRTVTLTRGSFVGPPPPDAFTRYFLGKLGRSPRMVVLFPVEVRSKVAAIFYGDAGAQPISQSRLSDFLLFCQELPSVFLEAELPSFDPETSATNGRDSAAPVAEWTAGKTIASESDLPLALGQLIGPDAGRRLLAIAQLSRFPEAAARELAARFPGPTAWTRAAVALLPEPAELGPVPGALAKLGSFGAAALARLLDSPDVDTRYWALLAAGRLPYPELLDGIQRGLFDPHPDISSAARAAAVGLSSLPRFEPILKGLRRELTASNAGRRAAAARALGRLHDRDAVDGLIGMAGSQDGDCASAAAEALKEITKVTHGTNPRQWSLWWAENRERPRAQWLLEGLRHPDLHVRLASIDELASAFGERLGYFADGPEVERQAAIHRWAARVHAAKVAQS